MSEGIVIALIGFAGAVLGAAIAGFATVTAAGIKGKGEGSISCGLVGLLASLGAAGGLVLGAVFGASVIQQRVATQPPPTIVANPTYVPTVSQPPVVPPGIAMQKVETQATGNGVRKTYTITLSEREIIVGHADKFQGYSPCVSFLIVGPGNFEFWVESGIWDYWTNVTPQMYESLLQEQVDILVNKYNCTPVRRVRLP